MQMSPEEHDAEQRWTKREKEEAINNVRAPIEDYSTASWFELEAKYNILGDQEALLEMRKRNPNV